MVTLRFMAGAVLLLSSATAAAATFTATVDRRELFVNEHVVLTLTLHDSETRLRAEGVAPNVDLTVLSDQFEIGAPRADFRFNIDRTRGRSTSTITVELFPRRSGRLTIPPFTVDGLTTGPIIVAALDRPADAAAEAFAVSGVGARRLHVRGQTLVFLDLYHRVSLDSARFGGQVETRPQQVEMHPLPQENRTETVNGIEYEVTRTAWAVSPLTTEETTILLPDIWIETRQGRQWRLPFSEERIEVAPPPASAPPDVLIGRPQVDIELPAHAVAGRMTTWELSLRVPTALNALPATLPFGDHDDALRIFVEPPERRLELRADGGVDSVAVYRGALMPLAPGAFAMPALALPWIDPDSGRLETLVVPGRTLQVDGAPLVEEERAGAAAVPADNGLELRIWQGITAVLLLSWLTAGTLWWRRRAVTGERTPRGYTPRASGDPVLDRLLAALGTRTLEQGLRERESRGGVDEELRTVIREVQRRRYHPDADRQNEAGLAERVDRVVERLRREPRAAGELGEDEWSPRAFHRAEKSTD